MKFGIKIKMRPVILDTQGRAVEETLQRQGFELQSCKVGNTLKSKFPSWMRRPLLKK